MPTHISWAAAGLLTIPSVCTGLTAGNSLFICDPTATGLSGTLIGYADSNPWSYFNNTDWSVKSVDSSNRVLLDLVIINLWWNGLAL